MEQTVNNKKPVIVLSGGRSTEPLMDALGKDYALAFLYPPAAQQAANKGITVVNLDQWATPETRAAAINEALHQTEGIWPAFENGHLPKLFEQTLMQNGIAGPTAADGLGDMLKGWFPEKVFQSVSRTIFRLMIWHNLNQAHNVRACVTHEDVAEETKSMVAYFRGQGIPTIHVPHAVYMNIWRGAPREDIADELTAEWIACAGPFQRAWYIERGANPTKTIVTGLPQWDKWQKQMDRTWSRQALNLPMDKPVVVYASSWAQATSALGMHDAIDWAYRSFLALAKENEKRWTAFIKLHPSADQASAKMHVDLVRECGLKAAVTPHYLEMVLGAADLVVSAGPSNILIEAAMLGVPGVSVFGYDDDHAVITCDPSTIGKAVKQGLSPLWREKFKDIRPRFLAKYAGPADGKATERVLKLVKEITCQP